MQEWCPEGQQQSCGPQQPLPRLNPGTPTPVKLIRRLQSRERELDLEEAAEEELQADSAEEEEGEEEQAEVDWGDL